MGAAAANPQKTGQIAQILLPRLLDTVFDYRVPDGAAAVPGQYVRVPFGREVLVGVVWNVAATSDVPAARLRELTEILPWRALPEAQRQFVDWVAEYLLMPRGMVLRLVLAGGGAVLKPARETYEEASSLTPRPVALSPEQMAAAEVLREKAGQEFSVTLLEGVTGSGKTEVYAELLRAVLARGQQALVLLPEIALGAQIETRLRDRLGVAPVAWHSALTPATRKRHFAAIREGQARLIIGARSALFLPYARLGALVVDEEHDAGYKQDDGVPYQARDLAIKRAQLEGVPVVLASATPSLETLANVQAGRAQHVRLTQRHAQARLPDIHLIDLRRDPPDKQEWLSPILRRAIEARMQRGEQSLLFLNRRGYAPLTLCRACGQRLSCPHCTAWLVEHRALRNLQCHHCGYQRPVPRACDACGEVGKMAACGPGVERVAEEVARHFPAAHVVQISTDHSIAEQQAALGALASGQAQIAIGTQILAKGHHFPLLTLVGVMDADAGLNGADPRAGERTFQLLQQVAGRSGRAERAGEVYLQSHVPDHPVHQALVRKDSAGFLELQHAERKAFGMPPYGRLIALLLDGAQEAIVHQLAQRLKCALAQQIQHVPDALVLGPAPAPLARRLRRHRVRILVKSSRKTLLQAQVREVLERLGAPKGVRIHVDVDPYTFL